MFVFQEISFACERGAYKFIVKSEKERNRKKRECERNRESVKETCVLYSVYLSNFVCLFSHSVCLCCRYLYGKYTYIIHIYSYCQKEREREREREEEMLMV